jgi:DNA replication protein DnaC
VLFVTAPALVAALAKGHVEGRLEERLGFFAKPKLLIVDLCAARSYVEAMPLVGLG